MPGITLPNGNQIVELRGWIHVGGPNLHDPDFSYGFTPDPEWLDYLGVDLATFVKVGDICNGYMGGGDAHACQNDFHIKLEVNGWPLAQPRGPAVPDDWQEYPWSPGIKWPFDPAAPTGGSLPDQCYVRISGSLVTDTPHNNHYASPDYQDAMTIWQGIEAMTSAREPGRWTEMHPPDIIEPLDPPKTPTVRLVGIAVVARSFALNPLDTYKEYTTDLAPLGQRPPGKKAFVKEFVGPETVFGSIVEGNGGLNGARITIYDDHVNVHVKVVGRGFNGTPGKFKGVYELWWG
ncbi:hypothetical protein [Arthrobacter bambusae]|uniref:Minor tail protein n=1 Tax=Arthrobacter bambusae TaxID=1338426 RepID=A0AAW8DDC6_9MICC|nr:hypothetical protein [Arthrobacter bambusae]MDP9903295.1 hypothetical protein [Arthrobacter bambusae]MDQ0128711.1 hypothetical protein [Arthrobacter bambusae]